MAKVKYRQCELIKSLRGSETRTVSYLPEKFAIVGRVLKLRDNDRWVDGWVVKSAGCLADEPPDYRKSIRSHKRSTGDSLPKVKT